MIQRSDAQYLIGLTGNIATGKSTVGRMLTELGATVIDADKAAHRTMRPGSKVFDRTVEAFGPTIIGDDGRIQRASLGNLVFSDPAALQRLEEIVHPATQLVVQRSVAEADTDVIVIEAIKLIEAGWHRNCHALWVTTCPAEIQVERLVTMRLLDREQACQRVAAQPPQALKIEVADVVIDTSGELAETRRQVEAAWQAIDTGGSYGSSGNLHRR
jgi:dephospho-CoA kinase